MTAARRGGDGNRRGCIATGRWFGSLLLLGGIALIVLGSGRGGVSGPLLLSGGTLMLVFGALAFYFAYLAGLAARNRRSQRGRPEPTGLPDG